MLADRWMYATLIPGIAFAGTSDRHVGGASAADVYYDTLACVAQLARLMQHPRGLV